MEYDMSLVTGRFDGDIEGAYALSNFTSYPKDKADRFIGCFNTFKDLIYGTTDCPKYSYAIYSGGPNEQRYDNINADGNINLHSNVNHFTMWFDVVENENSTKTYCDGGNKKAYTAFYSPIYDRASPTGGQYYATYRGNIIYNITKGLLTGEWTEETKNFLNMPTTLVE